jgi:UDP-glucose 4-epimerase
MECSKSVPVSEDATLAPITAYGAAKATAEIYLKLYREMHGLDCRIARIGNPYGAGRAHNLRASRSDRAENRYLG